MAWKTLAAGHDLPDAREDAKTAQSFGSFRISEKAVYLNGRDYLPLDAVRRIRLYRSQMNTHGCCGLGLPVWYVLVYYGPDTPLRLMSEKREQAQAALDRIAALRPGVEVMPPNDAA